jgi:D-threo-aldose 1-dehydrogenase
VAVSLLGYGASAAGVLEPGEDEGAHARIMGDAWARGLRYFDTSPWYGRGLSEHRLGAFLRHRPREACVVSTKVGRLLTPLPAGADKPATTLPFAGRFDYSYDATLRSVEDSLQRLGLARVDLLILHDLSPRWHGADLAQRYAEAMGGAHRALVALREQGLVRAIGVGVNDVTVCERCLADGDFDFFMLAGRLTLLDHAGAAGLLEACVARGVGVLAAAPYNSGILATGATASARYFYQTAPPDIVERTRALQAHCEAHGVPLGAAALQFALDHPAVVGVVPSYATPQQLAQACDWLATPIPSALWDTLLAAGLLHWHPGMRS